MRQQETDLPLRKWLWGWTDDSFSGADEYRAPLPPTAEFPEFERLPGVMIPPYVLVRRIGPEVAEVILCGASGWGTDMHVGDPNVPDEWKEPISLALMLVGRRWPGVLMQLNPEPDKDPDAV